MHCNSVYCLPRITYSCQQASGQITVVVYYCHACLNWSQTGKAIKNQVGCDSCKETPILLYLLLETLIPILPGLYAHSRTQTQAPLSIASTKPLRLEKYVRDIHRWHYAFNTRIQFLWMPVHAVISNKNILKMGQSSFRWNPINGYMTWLWLTEWRAAIMLSVSSFLPMLAPPH